jgi:hypothetical protein
LLSFTFFTDIGRNPFHRLSYTYCTKSRRESKMPLHGRVS